MGGLGTGAAARDPYARRFATFAGLQERGVPFGEHTIWQSTHPVRIVEVKTKTKAAFIEQMAGRAGIARSQTNYSNRFIQPVVTVLPGGAISSAD